MRLTILTDRRSVVMVAALVALAALPLFSVATADPYEPIRTLAAAAAAGLLCALGAPPSTRWTRGSLWAVGALVVLVAASALTGGLASAVFGVHGRYQGLVSAGALLVAGVAGAGLRSSHARAAGLALAGVGAVLGIIVAYQAATGLDPAATMNNRVIAGGWLAVSVAVVLATSYAASGRTRWLLVAAAVPGVVALGLTGSRGAWLGMLAGVAVVAVVALAGATARRRAFAVTAVVSSVVLVVLTAALAGGESASKLDPGALTQGSAASRWQIWRGAARMASAEPLLGHGPGRFLYEFPPYQPFEHAVAEAADTRPDQAHSWPLQLASESGLPAAALAVGLGLAVMAAGVAGTRRRDAAALIGLAGFAAYAIQALFSVPSVEVDALGWLLGGLVLARGAVATDEIRPISHRMLVAFSAFLAAAVVVACSLYLSADVWHARSRAAFAAGDMGAAVEAAKVAVARGPLIDVYRVALADGALYQSDPALRKSALAESATALDVGRALEPDSYDLALAAARVQAASGASADEVADAYLAAAALYPLGVEARTAAAAALRDAGRDAEAARIEDALARLSAARGGP